MLGIPGGTGALSRPDAVSPSVSSSPSLGRLYLLILSACSEGTRGARPRPSNWAHVSSIRLGAHLGHSLVFSSDQTLPKGWAWASSQGH